MGASTSYAIIRQAIKSAAPEIDLIKDYNPNYGLSGCTVSAQWNYTQKRPYKKDQLKSKKRVYIHIYYNTDRRAEDERKLKKLLSVLYTVLKTDQRQEKHEHLYDKYFDVKKISKGIQVKEKSETINEQKQYYGYFALISNEKLPTWDALFL